MAVLCQEYMLSVCLPLSSQPRLNLPSTQQKGHAPPVCPPTIFFFTTNWSVSRQTGVFHDCLLASL